MVLTKNSQKKLKNAEGAKKFTYRGMALYAKGGSQGKSAVFCRLRHICHAYESKTALGPAVMWDAVICISICGAPPGKVPIRRCMICGLPQCIGRLTIENCLQIEDERVG